MAQAVEREAAIDTQHVTPEFIKGPLQACGYLDELLKSDFPFGAGFAVPLAGFATSPTDSRSACVAVIAATGDPKKAVEHCKPLGAPLIFVCADNALQWWKQGASTAECLEIIPAIQVDRFFETHRREFSPEAVYRAKTWGRFKSEYQLAFVDVGLMPLVEEEVGDALGRLIERNVTDLKGKLGWEDLTSAQSNWLIKSVFWLVSGKILRDKKVNSFEDLDLARVEDVFQRVASHYGADAFSPGPPERLEALQHVAYDVDQFTSLALTTTEALAFVYENTLVSRATRSALGTHSTPSFLVDYVVGQLSEWIREIPENQRGVFEPACGHAAFLVSAMRLLTELLPLAKQEATQRGAYLRTRIHGSDIDAFALELARLSLTLTDIPNPDGWDLQVEDMFLGEQLSTKAACNTIFLANPPFANFSPEDREALRAAGGELRFLNRAAEMLGRVIPALMPGSVFGVVVPQATLHNTNASDVRRLLVNCCELKEICLFPDKVFSFSDVECAIILGRKDSHGISARRTRYRRFREPEMEGFRTNFAAPSQASVVAQSQFLSAPGFDLRLAELEDIWAHVACGQDLNVIADVGQGLTYVGENLLPDDVTTHSNVRFKGSALGFYRFQPGLNLHDLPETQWMSLEPNLISRLRSGGEQGIPQVLLNYAPVSRSPWRLKALIDHVGRPVTSRFMVVRPRAASTSLEFLWALLNSPIANAYAYAHLGKRDNLVGVVRRIPVPQPGASEEVESAVNAYLEAATEGSSQQALHHLLLRVDAVVLGLYELPPSLEAQLLELFAGHRRPGVPFKQHRYIPAALTCEIRLSDFLELEEDWERTNRERGVLIEKRLAGALTLAEQDRLHILQAYADFYLMRKSPHASSVLEGLERRLQFDN